MKCRLFMALLVVTVLAARTPSSFAGEKTSWYGFDRFDFLLDEAALTVQPFKASPDEKNGIKGEVKGQLRCVVVVPKEALPNCRTVACFVVVSTLKRASNCLVERK